MSKLIGTIREAIEKAGLKDGMTISFHHHMRNGDYAGLGALQEGYGLLAVKKYGGQKTIVIVEPESEPDDAALMMDVPTKETYIANLDQDEVYFKTEYEFQGEEYNDYACFL